MPCRLASVTLYPPQMYLREHGIRLSLVKAANEWHCGSLRPKARFTFVLCPTIDPLPPLSFVAGLSNLSSVLQGRNKARGQRRVALGLCSKVRVAVERHGCVRLRAQFRRPYVRVGGWGGRVLCGSQSPCHISPTGGSWPWRARQAGEAARPKAAAASCRALPSAWP